MVLLKADPCRPWMPKD